MSALHDLAAVGLGQLVWLTAASTLVFAVVGLLNRLLPRSAAGLRHALLLLVLLRLLVPPGVTSPLSAWPLLPGLQREALAVPAVTDEGALPYSLLGAATASGATAPARLPWPTLLFSAWALGAVAVGARRWHQRRRFRHLVAAARPLDDADLQAALARWRQRLGIRRRVRLVSVATPMVPFTLGTLRPAIVLPDELVAAAAERSGSGRLAEAVIAHELAHVARFDDLGLVLEQVASALFYFHPVLWCTARALGVERELAADRRVLSTRALSPRDYGHGLLQALGLDLTTTTVAAAAGSRRRLTMRMRQIADPRTATNPKRAHGVLAAGLLLSLPALLLPPAATGQTAAASPAATTPSATAVALPLVALQSSGPGLDALLLALHPSSGPSLDDLMPGARVTSPFGMRRHPTSGESVHHGGIDLSTGAESPVYAPRGGIVERVAHDYGDQGRFGTVVVVDHGSGVKTFYAHLASSSVAAGQGVGDGDQIGVAGNTGVSSGPHLHFEIWKDGERVDPARIGELVGGC